MSGPVIWGPGNEATLLATGGLVDVNGNPITAVNPLTTLGDTLYGGVAGAQTRLAGNTTTTPKYKRQVGNGSVSAAPTWAQPAFSELSGNATEAQGGTNQTTYAVGDTLYSSASNTLAKLAGNTSATRKFLSQTGNGSVSAAPAWVGPLAASDLPTLLPVSGTLATMQALTGVDGQTFWNTTYKALFQWTTDRWDCIYVDPRYGFILFEEFCGQDRIGALDWQTPGGAPPFAGNLLNAGLYQVNQTTASAQNNLRLELDAIQLGTMDLYWETVLAVPTLATVGEDFCLSVGLNDSASYNANGTCTDGAWISLNRAVNVKKWIYNTCSNTTATNTSSSSADVVAATFYRLNGYVNAGTSFTASINGASLGTAITTNLPTGAGRQTGFIYKVDKTAGTGSSAVQIDYFKMVGFYNGQRVA